ncbi:immunoglobulin lambda-1 light chain-like [Dendropsophus ebraccatus]|uniref:immunoglobulin lambda-1 light chain-like n=1 Tax=Dendropsophus ebraccatus TaxID=150705 RepID=UPI003831913B
MVKFQSFCLLLILLVESQAQHSVTQKPSITTSPGQTVKISCTLGGGLTVASNRVVFIQQKDNNVPRYILYYFTESSKGKGKDVPERFVGSASNNIGYLNINGVQQEDDAVYYCCTWTGSQWMFGPGTTVSVLAGEVKFPLVSILAPPKEEIPTDQVTIACFYNGFYPRIVSAEWTVDETKWTTGVQSVPVSKQADNLYMGSSLLTISALEFSKHKNFSCKVTHHRKEIIQTLETSQCY